MIVQPEARVTLDPWVTHNDTSREGRVLIRVTPGDSSFRVLRLDGARPIACVKAEHGPFGRE